MTSIARTERDQLCDTALQTGEAEPTLCEGWSVKDLLVHLLLRESGNPAAVGIVVPQLSGLADRASEKLARQDFTALVERFREGPPMWSPFALPKADELANTVELFIHHEDIRRAQPGWQARTLPHSEQEALWRLLRRMGRGLVRRAGVGVVVERADTGDRAVLNRSTPSVVVRGLPAELALFVYGRQEQADVTLDGPDDAVQRLVHGALGI